MKSRRKSRLAMFPGTFDPITNGHLDVIRRGAGLFDALVIAVGSNPQKTSLFSPAERAQIVREAVGDLRNVLVQTFEGLTVDFARKIGADVILRGIRNTSDLHFEHQVALTNRAVAGVETVFILTSVEYAFTSSELVRQIAQMGGDIHALVPRQVLPHLRRLRRQAARDKALHES